jgi:hypothetical protein
MLFLSLLLVKIKTIIECLQFSTYYHVYAQLINSRTNKTYAHTIKIVPQTIKCTTIEYS